MFVKEFDQIDLIFINLICVYLLILCLLLLTLFMKGGKRKRDKIAYIREVKANKKERIRLAKRLNKLELKLNPDLYTNVSVLNKNKNAEKLKIYKREMAKNKIKRQVENDKVKENNYYTSFDIVFIFTNNLNKLIIFSSLLFTNMISYICNSFSKLFDFFANLKNNLRAKENNLPNINVMSKLSDSEKPDDFDDNISDDNIIKQVNSIKNKNIKNSNTTSDDKTSKPNVAEKVPKIITPLIPDLITTVEDTTSKKDASITKNKTKTTVKKKPSSKPSTTTKKPSNNKSTNAKKQNTTKTTTVKKKPVTNIVSQSKTTSSTNAKKTKKNTNSKPISNTTSKNSTGKKNNSNTVKKNNSKNTVVKKNDIKKISNTKSKPINKSNSTTSKKTTSKEKVAN